MRLNTVYVIAAIGACASQPLAGPADQPDPEPVITSVDYAALQTLSPVKLPPPGARQGSDAASPPPPHDQ